MNFTGDGDLCFKTVLVKSGIFLRLIFWGELVDTPFLIERFFQEKGVVFDPDLCREGDA